MKNGQREEKKHSKAKEPYKSGKKANRVTKDRSLVKEDLSKVTKVPESSHIKY